MSWSPTLPRTRRFPLSLVVALVVYVALAGGTVNAVGVVGEVATSWGTGRPAAVLVEVDPPRWADGAREPSAGDRLGPLVASQARPIERLELGGLALPLAVNVYTGGLVDWPARLVVAATGWLEAATWLHVLLGAGLIVLVHRFLRSHTGDVAAAIGALLLATDWSFVFYRKVLGATEIALQAAIIACLWALWSRRWRAGRGAPLLFALGVGLGLCAKATFAVTLVALTLTALLTRWDKPELRPPLPHGLWRPVAIVAAFLVPGALTQVHHRLGVPADPHVVSHDFFGAQGQRVWQALTGGATPVREGLGNLSFWAGDPLGFFVRAYKASGPTGWSTWRVIGWAIIAAGTVLAWRDRHPTPHLALLRFTSLLLVLQVGLLLVVARDLHHLAQAAPVLAVVGGLSLERLSAVITPPRSFSRARFALLLALPWMFAGASALWRTDRVVDTIPVATFTERGQQAIVDLLRRNDVHRLVACSYELTGVLELRAPDIEVEHGWGAASRLRGAALGPLLRRASGAYFMVVRASAPMIYDLSPNATDLGAAAAEQGLGVAEVDRIDGAVLYAVTDPGSR